MMKALLVCLLIPSLAGCVPFQSVAQSTPAPSDCRLARTCAAIVPPCGPAISSTPSTPGLYYYGVEMPRNVAQVAGFLPLVPGGLAMLPATWDSAALLGPPSAPGPAPLLRQVSAQWPRPTLRNPPYTGPQENAVLVLDETPDTLGPLIGLRAELPRIGAQQAVMVAGEPATLYYLTIATAPARKYWGVELLWHSGTLTLRLLTGGFYHAYTSDNPISFKTTMVHGVAPDLGPALIQIADSVAPYTGCGGA